jgi:hypothetical protein
MASNINPYNIDGTFPVAGQDNPSQGFRDNFTNIKNNFVFAQSELNDLQTKAILTSALDGSTLNNDMAGTPIIRPQLSAWTQSLLDLGTISSNAVLNFNSGNFQKFTTAGAVTLTFTNWPASVGAGSLGYGLMRVWISVTNIAHTVTLDPKVTIAVTDIAGYSTATGAITFDSPGNYVFDFSSVDGGYNYLIFDVTRNRATFRDPALYYNPDTTNTFMIGYGSALTPALALEQGQDIISAHGSINSVGVGNLGLATVTSTQMDTGGIAGFSTTAARGNLATTTVTPVHSNDILGYVNAIAYTGNGTANVFQQVASIDFFATGTNAVNGLGANIAFFTADDGGAIGVKQAVGIENDQSARFFGDVRIAGNLNVVGTTSVTATLSNLANIADVNLTSLVNNQTIIYNTATRKWVNGNLTVANIANIADVNINSPYAGQSIVYSNGKWINSNTSVPSIANVGDVTIGTTAAGDFLRFDGNVSKWVNANYSGSKVNYAVTIGDDGSGGAQNVFRINGTAIKTNFGVTATNLAFKPNNYYVFDLSDASNAGHPMAFSTTPDTSGLASITAYTTGVVTVGTAGTAGAYIGIVITSTTPSPLYLYSTHTGDSLYGGAVAVPVNTITHVGAFVDAGYQYAAPSTSGFAISLSAGKSRLVLDPTTTLSTGNVILPNVAIDGTIVSIHSTATITTFGANSIQSGSGTVVKPSNTFTLSAGTGVDYFYHLSENTWYKIR